MSGILFVNPLGEAASSVIIFSAREGDLSVNIEQQGFADDVDVLLYGYMNCCYPNHARRSGLVWDESRILTFIGGDAITEQELGFLVQAGFTLPEGY